MNQTIKNLFSYISAAKTPFHAVSEAKRMLLEAGFTALNEADEWNLLPGHAYFTDRSGSALIAFRLPGNEPDGFQIVSSHSDSPTFKIKENAELTSEAYVRLNVEPYGGMICSSWFDRPLSVAGRILVKTAEGVETRLISFDRDLLMIPNVAIHMNRSVNSGYAYNMAVDMMPLFGGGNAKGAFKKMVADEAGCAAEDILGNDLFLYNRMPGTEWGEANEFISAPRLDDLECAYASLAALIAAENPRSVAVTAILDNEEVGSGTKQGADSDFLPSVLHRIAAALGKDADFARMTANSFMVSADNAHAVHPNHPEYADPTHRPVMNGGIVIKFNANQKYTTDGVSDALFEILCKRACVPFQFFANRSDLPGGSTLGNIANTHVSMNTVDIGLPQLAMHSAYETAGAKDPDFLIAALKEVFLASVKAKGNGVFTLG